MAGVTASAKTLASGERYNRAIKNHALKKVVGAHRDSHCLMQLPSYPIGRPAAIKHGINKGGAAGDLIVDCKWESPGKEPVIAFEVNSMNAGRDGERLYLSKERFNEKAARARVLALVESVSAQYISPGRCEDLYYQPI
jgi:hypothetical protein